MVTIKRKKYKKNAKKRDQRISKEQISTAEGIQIFIKVSYGYY